jgi:hypothetical protein
MTEKTFKSAFKGNEEWLAEKLSVTKELLRALKDKGIIKEASVSTIDKEVDESDKVDALIKILRRANDAFLSTFCDILIEQEQEHVVERIWPEKCSASSSKLVSELKEVLEPDYGLPLKLRGASVITSEQYDLVREAVRKADVSVHHRVTCLLEALRENGKSLNDETFLKVLREDDQTHVVNLIAVNGSTEEINGDDRPLNEQQRLRFHDSRLYDEMDSKNQQLQNFLFSEKVISRAQRSKVMSQGTPEEANELLIRILTRRSVANVKRFIVGLRIIGQASLVDSLVEAKVVVLVRSFNRDPAVIEDFRRMEERVVASSRCLRQLHQTAYDIDGWFRETDDGCEIELEITSVELINSLGWYIVCRNAQTLERLWQLYDSGTLSEKLGALFNRWCGCEGHEAVQLHIEWSYGDFENCKAFLNESGGLPFGPIYEVS